MQHIVDGERVHLSVNTHQHAARPGPQLRGARPSLSRTASGCLPAGNDLRCYRPKLYGHIAAPTEKRLLIRKEVVVDGWLFWERVSKQRTCSLLLPSSRRAGGVRGVPVAMACN